jgi:hypothetical protein
MPVIAMSRAARVNDLNLLPNKNIQGPMTTITTYYCWDGFAILDNPSTNKRIKQGVTTNRITKLTRKLPIKKVIPALFSQETRIVLRRTNAGKWNHVEIPSQMLSAIRHLHHL